MSVALGEFGIVTAEHEHAMTALFLSGVAGCIGGAEHVRCTAFWVVQGHQPDARAYGVALSMPIEAQLTEKLQKILGDVLRVFK